MIIRMSRSKDIAINIGLALLFIVAITMLIVGIIALVYELQHPEKIYCIDEGTITHKSIDGSHGFFNGQTFIIELNGTTEYSISKDDYDSLSIGMYVYIFEYSQYYYEVRFEPYYYQNTWLYK